MMLTVMVPANSALSTKPSKYVVLSWITAR